MGPWHSGLYLLLLYMPFMLVHVGTFSSMAPLQFLISLLAFHTDHNTAEAETCVGLDAMTCLKIALQSWPPEDDCTSARSFDVHQLLTFVALQHMLYEDLCHDKAF